MFPAIDLNKLKVFREVVMAGSFSKAALNLRTPKSRISRLVASLERELKTQLIYRTTRQFRLTEAGSDLFNRISPLIQELEKSLEFVSIDSEGLAGLIKVTAPEDLAIDLLGKICHDFIKIHPNIQIGLHASNSIMDLVKESIDVSIRIGRVKDSTMIQKRIGRVEMILVMSPELFKLHRPRKLEDLLQIPFLGFETKNLKTHKIKLMKGNDSKTLKISLSFGTNNYFVLRSMALQGAGLTLMPSFLVKNLIERGQLIHVCKDWKAEGQPVQILIPQQKEVPPRIKAFMDFMGERLIQSLN